GAEDGLVGALGIEDLVRAEVVAIVVAVDARLVGAAADRVHAQADAAGGLPVAQRLHAGALRRADGASGAAVPLARLARQADSVAVLAGEVGDFRVGGAGTGEGEVLHLALRRAGDGVVPIGTAVEVAG